MEKTSKMHFRCIKNSTSSMQVQSLFPALMIGIIKAPKKRTNAKSYS